MSVWPWGRGKDDPPPQPPVRTLRLSVWGKSGLMYADAFLQTDNGDKLVGSFDGQRMVFTTLLPEHGAWLTVGSPGYLSVNVRVVLTNELPDVRLEPKVLGRQDVRLVSRIWHDANGPFFPLGTSLLHAVGTWHRGEAARVRANLSYIRDQKFDYIRILGQAGWKDQEIDPFWPDYRETLAAVIDAAYDDFGLHVQVTAIGGGHNDPVGCARIIREVVNARPHKVIMLEAVNEGNEGDETAIAIAELFQSDDIPYGVGLGDRGIGTIKACGNEAHSDLDFYHTERASGDNGARQVRQCWNMKEFGRAVVNNEPPGPNSSGGQLSDAFKLAAMRAGSIICGSGAFCFHTGAGVYGQGYQSSYGYRHANLFEVPNMREMMEAIRHASDHLPAGIENWTKYNTNKPLEVQSGTVNKVYGARSGAQFVQIIIGAEGQTTFKAREAMAVQISNPATGEIVLDMALPKDGTCKVSGLWAYVVKGIYK